MFSKYGRMCLLFGVVLVAPGLVCGAEPPAADPRTELDTMIPYAIKLLEEKKYEQFVREIVNPDSAKRMEKDFAKDGGFAKGVQDWGRDLGPFTLILFKEFKGQKPAMTADGTQARFSSTKLANDTGLSFRKFDKFWRVAE